VYLIFNGAYTFFFTQMVVVVLTPDHLLYGLSLM
jgi:hypothetical protein